jgi:hypothetical protein
MLQNRAISSSVPSPVPTELADSLERTLTDERLRVVKRTLSLPDTPQSFLVFLLLLMGVCGALTCHLLLSTAIHESELRLAELKAINRAIEQESTILIQEIAESSSLVSGMERARALGYETAYEYRYILQPTGQTSAAALSIDSFDAVSVPAAPLAVED